MAEQITVRYVQVDDRWEITVSARGEQLAAVARGIVAARNRAELLVEQIAPGEKARRVVHLLNDNALEFTMAYMSALLNPRDELSARPAMDAQDAGGDATDAKPAQ